MFVFGFILAPVEEGCSWSEPAAPSMRISVWVTALGWAWSCPRLPDGHLPSCVSCPACLDHRHDQRCPCRPCPACRTCCTSRPFHARGASCAHDSPWRDALRAWDEILPEHRDDAWALPTRTRHLRAASPLLRSGKVSSYTPPSEESLQWGYACASDAP